MPLAESLVPGGCSQLSGGRSCTLDSVASPFSPRSSFSVTAAAAGLKKKTEVEEGEMTRVVL